MYLVSSCAGPRGCAQASSGCDEWGHPLAGVCGLLVWRLLFSLPSSVGPLGPVLVQALPKAGLYPLGVVCELKMGQDVHTESLALAPISWVMLGDPLPFPEDQFPVL